MRLIRLFIGVPSYWHIASDEDRKKALSNDKTWIDSILKQCKNPIRREPDSSLIVELDDFFLLNRKIGCGNCQETPKITWFEEFYPPKDLT